MNAFPPELLLHHFACMVVAGLTPPSKSSPSTTAAAAVSSNSGGPSSSTPINTASDASAPGAASDHPTVVFPDLTRSVHEILASRARNTLWDPSRGRAAVFHTVFADHNVRLPPLKTKPSARHVPPIPSVTTGSPSSPCEAAIAAFSALPPRSPLSPLHPNSPQFPDGLIAPVWVRKHRELIPAVFVSFHCLVSASDMEHVRIADEALIKTIADRRRSLAERGIKLTIVLLTQREMLDDAQLDARLSFVRRSSGLDSKASLFVLTPVTKPELAEFVSSLHGALFESAADYYREHARRVKRKRTRYPPPASTLHPLVTALGTLPSALASAKTLTANDISWLSRQGWIVRSEYKLAVFAELAGDMHEAALRYREAYDLLCNSPTCLLGSTLMLPPRTKRWAEAKVLADTLSVRICKLLLYADDGQGAAVFFRRHLARFTDLSTGWGIGAITFEYWSWLAKQYRMFGELVEHATRAVPSSPLAPFQLPMHAPPLPSRLIHPDALPRFSDGRGGVVAPPGLLLPNSNAVSVSANTCTVLQTPGAYYYLAALCTVERRQRFLSASAASTTTQDDSDSSPLSHERKVDHTAQLTESLTKAYDSFKRNRLYRCALLVAARIATAYHDGGQNEMALKFLERILKSYAKDEVHCVRAGLVETAVQAAIGAADRTSAMKMLIEVLDPTLPIEMHNRDKMVSALKTFLGHAHGEAGDMPDAEQGQDEESTITVPARFLHMDTAFPAAQVEFGAQVPFQVVIRNAHPSFDLAQLFTAELVTLYFSNGQHTHESAVEIDSCNDADGGSCDPLIVDLGSLDLTSTPLQPIRADLDALLKPKSGTIAFQGHIKASHAGAISVARVSVHLACAKWKLQLDVLPVREAVLDSDTAESGLNTARWLLANKRSVKLAQRQNPSVTYVRPKRFNVSLALATPTGSLYIDERIALTVRVSNHEDVPVQVWIDARLQPSYDGGLDTLMVSHDDAREANGDKKQSVELLSLGSVDAGGKVERKIWLTARQASGVRVVNVTVRVAGVGDVDAETVEVATSSSCSIGVHKAFECVAWIKRGGAQARGREKGLLEFDDPEEEEEEETVKVGLDVEMVGEQAVTVSKVEVVCDGEMLVAEEDALGEWMPNDRFSFVRALAVHASPIGWRITWSRAISDEVHSTMIVFSDLSGRSDGALTARAWLNVTLSYATSARLLMPLPVHVTLHNTHAWHSLSVLLTLDSDAHFTLAATRHLCIPYVLPGQQLDLTHFARLTPQQLGTFALPVIGVRVLDRNDPTLSRLASTSLSNTDKSDAHDGSVPGSAQPTGVLFTYARVGSHSHVDDTSILPSIAVSL